MQVAVPGEQGSQESECEYEIVRRADPHDRFLVTLVCDEEKCGSPAGPFVAAQSADNPSRQERREDMERDSHAVVRHRREAEEFVTERKVQITRGTQNLRRG